MIDNMKIRNMKDKMREKRAASNNRKLLVINKLEYQ